MQGCHPHQITDIQRLISQPFGLRILPMVSIREIIDQDTKWRSGPENKAMTDIVNCGYWCSPENNEWATAQAPRKRDLHCRIEWFADDPLRTCWLISEATRGNKHSVQCLEYGATGFQGFLADESTIPTPSGRRSRSKMHISITQWMLVEAISSNCLAT